jgi:hypothetical protein
VRRATRCGPGESVGRLGGQPPVSARHLHSVVLAVCFRVGVSDGTGSRAVTRFRRPPARRWSASRRCCTSGHAGAADRGAPRSDRRGGLRRATVSEVRCVGTVASAAEGDAPTDRPPAPATLARRSRARGAEAVRTELHRVRERVRARMSPAPVAATARRCPPGMASRPDSEPSSEAGQADSSGRGRNDEVRPGGGGHEGDVGRRIRALYGSWSESRPAGVRALVASQIVARTRRWWMHSA